MQHCDYLVTSINYLQCSTSVPTMVGLTFDPSLSCVSCLNFFRLQNLFCRVQGSQITPKIHFLFKKQSLLVMHVALPEVLPPSLRKKKSWLVTWYNPVLCRPDLWFPTSLLRSHKWSNIPLLLSSFQKRRFELAAWYLLMCYLLLL